MPKSSLFAMLFLTIAFAGATSAAMTKTTFESAVDKIGNGDHMVGLAVAIVREGEVSSINTYGVREYGRPEKIDSNTVFRIASLSKTFAATVTGQLIEEKKLSLESPITKFNKNFALRDQAQAESATLSHVLSHRLSLPPYAYDNLLEAGVTPSKILQEMKKVTPICKVGKCYAYQNVGFNMITSAVKDATGQDYAELVNSRLFKPLGMKDASFGKHNLIASGNWARSHRRSTGFSWVVRDVKQPYYDLPAAGGVNASILDLSKWLSAHMGNATEIISEQTLNMLHTPVVKTHAELRRNKQLGRLTDAYYGLGWRIYTYAGQTVVNHSGSVEGYTAQIAFLPKYDVGIVALSNSRSREFWSILPLFLDHELGLTNKSLVDAEVHDEL